MKYSEQSNWVPLSIVIETEEEWEDFKAIITNTYYSDNVLLTSIRRELHQMIEAIDKDRT